LIRPRASRWLGPGVSEYTDDANRLLFMHAPQTLMTMDRYSNCYR